MKTYNRLAGILFFLALPLLFWALGDTPRRSFLKEIISILTLLAYFLMLGQFFLSRGNRGMLKPHKMGKVLRASQAHRIPLCFRPPGTPTADRGPQIL